MTKIGKLFAILTVLMLAVVASPKPAFAVPVLGGELFALGGAVTVTLQVPSSIFISTLFLDPPPGGGPGAILATSPTDAGIPINLGSFAAGTELVFGIKVNDTEFAPPGTSIFEYRMGPGSRNPDLVEHAQVDVLNANEALVGFEDKNTATPGYDNDLNDVIFKFVGVGPSENVVPEPASLMLLGLGLVGAGLRGRKRKV